VGAALLRPGHKARTGTPRLPGKPPLPLRPRLAPQAPVESLMPLRLARMASPWPRRPRPGWPSPASTSRRSSSPSNGPRFRPSGRAPNSRPLATRTKELAPLHGAQP
jgi:hypothetical protein